MGAYCASKFAAEALSDALRLELMPQVRGSIFYLPPMLSSTPATAVTNCRHCCHRLLSLSSCHFHRPDQGIHVSIVQPGPIVSNIWDRFREATLKVAPAEGTEMRGLYGKMIDEVGGWHGVASGSRAG